MRALFALVAVLAFAPATLATADPDCEPSTTRPWQRVDVPLPEGTRTIYVWVDWAMTNQIWVYEESNGIEGLQRADEMHDDTCGGMIAGDTIVL